MNIKPELIREFAAGDEVPDWLVAQDMKVPHAVKGRFTFNKDVAVFILRDGTYAAIPATIGGASSTPMFTIENASNMNYHAVQANVICAHGFTAFFTPEDGRGRSFTAEELAR